MEGISAPAHATHISSEAASRRWSDIETPLSFAFLRRSPLQYTQTFWVLNVTSILDGDSSDYDVLGSFTIDGLNFRVRTHADSSSFHDERVEASSAPTPEVVALLLLALPRA